MCSGRRYRGAGTTERQFSRDIASASGYLLASGRERLYTAADRGDTFRILRA